MIVRLIKYRTLIIVAALLMVLPTSLSAQEQVSEQNSTMIFDDTTAIKADTLSLGEPKKIKVKRNWSEWRPETKRAMWLALVLPGAGQIYNRKYWKLPIIYGGAVGCIYALNWNGQMYKDYKKAYIDLVDDDPETKSYEKFMTFGMKIDESNKSYYSQMFSRRKDRFRRYRDMSFFCMIGVYALSVIDAYVDASLSEFDISDDLSLRIEPAYLNNNYCTNPLKSGGFGIQCNLNF